MPPPTAAAVSLPQLPLRATPARPRSCCHRPPAPRHSWNGGAAGHGPWAAGCGLRAAGCRGVVCRACRAPDGGAGNGMQWVHSRASLRGVAVCPACPPCTHCTLGPGTHPMCTCTPPLKRKYDHLHTPVHPPAYTCVPTWAPVHNPSVQWPVCPGGHSSEQQCGKQKRHTMLQPWWDHSCGLAKV